MILSYWHAVGVRLRAGAIHLAISAVAASIAIGVIFLAWYPGLLAQAQGVSELVLIMIGVDVMIGPLLTTLIFRPGKWGLRFDLGAIAVLQISALLYGMHTIYLGRPAYVVFNVDRFDVVSVQEVDRSSLERAASEFKISLLRPLWVAARFPEDAEARGELLFRVLDGGADLPQLPEHFVTLHEESENIRKRLHPIAELRKLNEMSHEEWERAWAKFERPENSLGYLPMRAKSRDGTVVIDRHTGAVLGIQMMRPDFGTAGKRVGIKDDAGG